VYNTTVFDQGALWDRLDEDPEQTERLRLLVDLTPADARRVLDVGCGDGRWLARLAGRCEVHGVEPSAGARSRASVPVSDGSATRLAFHNAAFDLVGCHQVLEHLPDADLPQACVELARVSARYLLISVPYREQLSMRRCRCLDCGATFNPDGHLRRFRSARQIARRFPGFRVIGTRTYGRSWTYRPKWLGEWIVRLTDRYAVEPLARCPHCGRPADSKPPRKRRLTDKVLDAIEWRIRRDKPRWMTVLLERVSNRASGETQTAGAQ
jgi:SAM-dependent methyltransferase